MAKISTVSRRFRETRGNYYLTHGSDTADHRAANKARRAMDVAVIEEQLAELDPVSVGPCAGSFRVVVVTQVYENYGVHACECDSEESCSCVDYWKPKGGSEYVRDIGDVSSVIALGARGVEAVALEVAGLVTVESRGYSERVIAWELVSSAEETCEERESREMVEWGYLSVEQRGVLLARRVR